MMTLKEITNKYPTTNDEWSYRCMPSDIGIYRNDLNVFLHDVLFGIRTLAGNPHYTSTDYVGINEFFVRQSTSDDFYENPAVFTHKGHDNFNYRGNSDPWGRMFKVYKNGMNKDMYKCKAILGADSKPMVYVLSTSVEGNTIYCVDRINV